MTITNLKPDPWFNTTNADQAIQDLHYLRHNVLQRPGEDNEMRYARIYSFLEAARKETPDYNDS